MEKDSRVREARQKRARESIQHVDIQPVTPDEPQLLPAAPILAPEVLQTPLPSMGFEKPDRPLWKHPPVCEREWRDIDFQFLTMWPTHLQQDCTDDIPTTMPSRLPDGLL
jgi:hypothetical protein